MSEILLNYAELLSSRLRIMQYPNRAEMVVIFIIVGLINDFILFLIGSPADFYLYYPIVFVVLFEEFVQLSIVSHIKNEKLLSYCLKYAFIYWFIETVNNYIIFIHEKMYLDGHLLVSTLGYLYGRSWGVLIYLPGALTRFYSLTRFRKYAALLFFCQVIIHTAWNINQPPIIDAIFAPILKLEQIFEGLK